MSFCTVAATMTYRRHCPGCMLQIEHNVARAIRDGEVTSVVLKATPKCEHQTALPDGKRPRGTAAAPPIDGTGPTLPGMIEAAVLISPQATVTSGAVDAEPALPLEHVEGLGVGIAGAGHPLPNGLDPEGHRT